MQRSNFPWWYKVLKWIPFVLAASTGYLVAGGLCGFVTIPAQLGMLQWAPVFYGSLEGLNAIAALALITGAISSLVGVVTGFITNGILCSTAEKIANNESSSSLNANEENQTLKHTLEETKKELGATQANANKALAAAQRYSDKVDELQKHDEVQVTRVAEAPSVVHQAVPPQHARPPFYPPPYPYSPMPMQMPYYVSHCAKSTPYCAGHQQHHHGAPQHQPQCAPQQQSQPSCHCSQ